MQPKFIQDYFQRMDADMKLSSNENYIFYDQHQQLVRAEACDKSKGHFIDRNQSNNNNYAGPIRAELSPAPGASVNKLKYKNSRYVQIVDDGNPQGASVDTRLISMDKTPQRTPHQVQDTREAMTSSTDQGRSHVSSYMADDTVRRQERAG